MAKKIEPVLVQITQRRYWRRDYAAIALYGYLTAVLGFQIFDLPGILEDKSWWFIAPTVGTVWLGCLICMISRFWRDDLDGGAIEQTGLAVTLIGWFMYAYAFAIELTDHGRWFGLILVGGFIIAFVAQWWEIHHWRAGLKKTVN